MIIMLGVALFFLPHLVSTEWFKTQVERQALRTLCRPVRMERLHWTWSNGILLERLQIEEAPAFPIDL